MILFHSVIFVHHVHFLYSRIARGILFPLSRWQSFGSCHYRSLHDEAVWLNVAAETTSTLGIARQDANVVVSARSEALQGVRVLGCCYRTCVESREVFKVVVLQLVLLKEQKEKKY